jgi:hypothetical protein
MSAPEKLDLVEMTMAILTTYLPAAGCWGAKDHFGGSGLHVLGPFGFKGYIGSPLSRASLEEWETDIQGLIADYRDYVWRLLQQMD